MIIENIKWREVVARHMTSKKEFAGKIDQMAEALIDLEGNKVNIREVSPFSNNRSWLYSNPKVTKLSVNELEIEAEWWGTTYLAKGPAINHPNHKVIITAKF